MNNKITIIEGPTPEFQIVSQTGFGDGSQSWSSSVLEGPFLFDTAFTNLRTFDAQRLIERCQDTWAAKQTMFLEYKDRIGLLKEDPIIAARALKAEEGDILLLWVRRELSDDEEEDDQDFNDFDENDLLGDDDSLF